MRSVKQRKKYVEVEFTEDFATKKQGDVIKVNSMMACDLVKRGVAKVNATGVFKEQTTPEISPAIKKPKKSKK